ncbi:MAG TPA: ExeM/NucH family extracellular endonuclease, partial [Anaerolineae bacterium]|nr:ExeM/NucH family extracellular endonuclease [Anaerolineae bacterium]
QDTDNNANDFQVLTTPTPQNTASTTGSAIGFSIVKSAPASVSVSQTFTYTLIATNRISETALSVIITDAVPLSATIVSVSDSGAVLSCCANVVSWTIGSAQNGEAITRTIVVIAPMAATTLINSDYGVWAGNYLTRTTGNAVNTTVTASSGTGCGGAFAPIYMVQGIGLSSPLVGQPVTIEGVVVGDFQASTQQSGFYLQDPIGDSNSATSDGVFVYAPGGLDVSVGDVVRVTGTVVEFNELTELSPVTSVTLCSSGQPLAPTVVDLPVAATNDQERFEGMYVTIPETLTVDQNFFQGRYGQVTLSADGRMYNPTNGNGFGDTLELNARRMLILDDGTTAQNPNPIPYIGADNTLRAGDVITNLTGVIDYGPINSNTAIQHYRLQPTGPVTISRAQPRTATPAAVGGSIHVASFNVLNYFNGNGDGTGFPTARGATTLAEFNRQRNKIIPAIVALNADVVGLMEIENDGTGSLSAIQDLVNGLNAATSAGTYAFVSEPAPGGDQIKVAMI